MKNLFKKLLACCLAVCMVLTLCVGAITVGAEAAGYLTVGTVDITTDDKAAEVPVTIFSTAGIAAAEINVRVPENLSIAKLELVTEDTNVEVTFASAADPSGAPELLDSKVATSDVAPNVIDGVFTYIVHLPAGKVATTQVNVLITFAGAFAQGKIPVTADVEACKDATSDLLELAITDGAINVAAAHVCAPAETVEENRVEATCYAEGSYDEVVKCSCGKELDRTTKTIEKIAHTPAEAVVENNKAATCYAEGSYDSVIYCAVEACKAEISRTPVTVDKTEHTPAIAVVENEVPATCVAEGSYDSVVYCSVEKCKYEISRTTIPTAKLDHDFGDNLEFCANNCGTANPDYVAPCTHANTELKYALVDGNCVTTKVCLDCEDYNEVIYSEKSLAVTPALNLSAGLSVNFRIYQKDVKGTNPYAIINHDLYEGEDTFVGTSTDINAERVDTGNTASNKRHQFWYYALSAQEMLSAMHVNIYATVDGNDVLIAKYDFVIADYLKTQYIDSNSANKTLAADILRYGAETQKAFGYRTAALPTEGVDPAAFSALPTTFTNVVSTQASGNKVALEPSTVLENTVTLRFRATKITGVPMERLHFTISYIDEEGNPQTYTSPDGVVGQNGNGKKYQFDFSNLPVAIINDVYTVTLWDGETAISSMEYSFQYDAQDKFNKAHANATLAQAIVAYSASAAARFKS